MVKNTIAIAMNKNENDLVASLVESGQIRLGESFASSEPDLDHRSG